MAERSKASSEQLGSLFRGEALQRFTSPERLDERVSLIPPAMRVVALSLAILLVAGLVWAVLGDVPTRVRGRGVLLADGRAAHAVQPIVAGPVIALMVSRGDLVDTGVPIARVQQVSFQTELTGVQSRLTILRNDLEDLKKAHVVERAKLDSMLKRQKAAVHEQISAGELRVKGLKDILTADENLFQRGMVSRMEVANARAAYDQTMLEIANAHAREIEIEAVADQKRDELAETTRLKQEQVDALQAVAERLSAELSLGAVVKAPVSGRIEEIRVGVGDFVSPGTVIATVAKVSPKTYEVIAVFGNNMSKRIAPRMDVQISPVSVRKEEHGSMRGRVQSITDLGISRAELNAILRNPQLTDSLMSGDGAPLLARIDVVLDKSTPSGFAWWSGRGPPYMVTRGTQVEVDVIVDRQPPIALIIPALRHLLGLEG